MSDSFCGIDPPALSDLAEHLEWVGAGIDTQAGRAYARMTRHSRWSAADGINTQLGHISRWTRLSATDLRQRAESMILAQTIDAARPLFIEDPWWRWAGPLPRTGRSIPGFPTTNPLGFLVESDIPWSEIEDWVRGALGIWNGRQDDSFPIGRWVAGLLYVNRVAGFLRADRALPTIANGWTMRQLANTRYMQRINPVAMTVGRRASIGLSAYSTASDATVVYRHGNPIDAFEQEGAGYVADVARLGFSTSTTAFLVAPNPITGGLVIVTGVVWAGAEVVDHWDETAQFWSDTYSYLELGTDWLEGRLGEAQEWAAAQADAVQDWTRGQLDNLSRGWDWTNDFVSDRVGEVGVLGEDITDGFVAAADYAGNRLGAARDWTGDRIDDLVDVGGGIVDGGIDIGKKLIPGW